MKHCLPALLCLALFACTPTEKPPIANFEECAASGNPVMESYPRQCRTPDGQTFTEDVGNELEKADLIRISVPRPGALLEGTTVIMGEARGTWYFEATFPIVLLNSEGNVIATHYATAQSDWMTEEFVPFTAELDIPPTDSEEGALILKKANASGLPEFDDELRIPVKFLKQETTSVTLYFYSEEDLGNAMFDSPIAIKRTIIKTPRSADTALRELFNGPTEEDHMRGARTSDDLEKLGGYYLGVTIHPSYPNPYATAPKNREQPEEPATLSNVAIVNFRPEALSILNSAAARQMMAKSPIEATLLEFPTVKYILYAIDGEVFDEWDA